MAKEKTPEVNNKQAKVNGVIVMVSQPYGEGHVINANEAKALNQTRTENIQNNTRNAVKKIMDEAGEDADSLTEGTLKAIQKLVSDYDSEYEFAVRTSSAAVVDPKEKEARKLVRENIKAQLKDSGVKVSDVPKDALDAKIDEVLADKDGIGKLFWDTAESNLAQKARIADAKLGNLSL